jgi:phage replication initiation protein
MLGRQPRTLAETLAVCVEPGVVLPGGSFSAVAVGFTPPTNRGVESAELKLEGPKGREAFVDYVRFSVTQGCMVDGVDGWRRYLSGCADLEDAGWRAGNGGHFYKESWCLGGWTIYYDGRQDGMGYCVQLSGVGCREFEARPYFTTWEQFFYGLLGKGGSPAVNFTRLDVALDDKEEALDIAEIERKTRAGEYSCRGGSDIDASPSLRSSRPRGGKAEAWGVTVYFGRRTSSQLVRVYNKAVEQANKLGQEVGGHWVRVEYEAHDERAAALAEQVVLDGLGCVAGVILNYVDFKEDEATNAQKCRQKTCGWWSAFLAGWEKIALAVAPAERTILKVRLWLENQVAASLATAYESLVGPQRKLFLADLVQLGQGRMKKRHRDLLAREKALIAAVAPCGGPTGF